jgi:hypothetical protein
LGIIFAPRVTSNRYPDRQNWGKFWSLLSPDLNLSTYFFMGFLEGEAVPSEII